MFTLCRWNLPLARFLGAAALILTAVIGLSACGASSSTTSSAPTSPATTSRAITVPGRPIAEPNPPHSSSNPVVPHPSHGPSGFRVPKGDNSVPNFGQEARTSERQLAVAALTAFMRARANGEWSKVCDYVARADRRLPEGIAKQSQGKIAGCGAALKALMTGPRSEYADTLTHGIAALRIKGKAAFALFYGPHAQKYVMPMQKEGGMWKMAQLAPLPYPLGTPSTGAP
jgi:hypothetical protein